MSVLFSIIVPVYNGEKTIRNCIESVQNQTMSNWELIIVNDGSKDRTVEICASFTHDDRIRVITKLNGGVSDTRNRGIAEAVGEYLIFLDADDSLVPDACETFEKLMKNSDYCISGFNRIKDNKFYKADIPIGVKEQVYNLDEFGKVWADLYFHGFTNAPWGKCYKRALIISCFDKNLSLGEDLIFNLQYLVRCNRIAVSNVVTYNYLIQSYGSLSSSNVNNGFIMLDQVYKKTYELLRQIGILNNCQVQSAVDDKYTVDFLVMLERKNRNGEKISTKDIIDKFNMLEVFSKSNVRKYSLKYEIERWLLTKEMYVKFEVLSNLFGLLSKIKRG